MQRRGRCHSKCSVKSEDYCRKWTPNFVFRFIERAENELEQNTIKATFIEWAYESNITDHNEKKKLDHQVRTFLLPLGAQIIR